MILLSAPFLLLVVVVFPLYAYRGAKAEPVPRDQWPPPRTIYLQIIVNQSIVAGAAWLAAYGAGLETTWLGEMNPVAALLGAGFLVAMLGLSFAGQRRGESEPGVADAISPKSAGDWLVWAAALVAAAVCEEYAYRGVLFGLGERWFGTEAGVAIAAILFGLAHRTQGWLGVIASSAFAVAMHATVLLSGGLAVAIVTHFVYDSSVEFLARLLKGRSAAAAG